MKFSRLLLCLLALALLPACALEPIGGCVLAAANKREILRAKAYLHPALKARIARILFTGMPGGHAMLVYRLDAGWWAYDDFGGSRSLHMTGADFPDPKAAAKAAFPGHPVFFAQWIDPEVPPPRALTARQEE